MEMNTAPTLDVISLGENMLRLSPPSHERISQTSTLEMRFGGAESNVALALARLGLRAGWLSRLPDNALGQRVVAELNAQGVNTTGVRLAPGERLGTYFIEQGVAPRPNRMIYDRANSAFSNMRFADVALPLVDGARWLHITGITAALNEGCRNMALKLVEYAHAAGLTVSFDVNYRALLWSPAQAQNGLLPILKNVDILFCAHRDAMSIFGVSADPLFGVQDLLGLSGGHTCVLTTGEEGAVAISTKTTGTTKPMVDAIAVPGFKVSQVIDRVGAGDAFDAGFIAGQLRDLSLAESIRYGHACSALKITIPGDLALISADEVELLLAGGGAASLR